MTTLDLLFKGIGGVGILLISLGLLQKDQLKGSISHLSGGFCLEAYSIFIGDPVFIILQAIFISVAGYKVFSLKRQIKAK